MSLSLLPCACAQVHTARRFAEVILPTAHVLEVESPDLHIGRFTPDGAHLVSLLRMDWLLVLLQVPGHEALPRHIIECARHHAGVLLAAADRSFTI
jgi:hypothetical protein